MPKSGARPRRRKFSGKKRAVAGAVAVIAIAAVVLLALLVDWEGEPEVAQEAPTDIPVATVDSLPQDTTLSADTVVTTPVVTPSSGATPTESSADVQPRAPRGATRPTPVKAPVGVSVGTPVGTPARLPASIYTRSGVVQSRVLERAMVGRRVVVVHTGTVNIVHSGTIRVIIKK